MNEEIKNKSWYEETQEMFFKNIDNTETLDRAICILEDRKEILDINLDLQQKIEQLEKENQKFFEELNTCMIERNSFLDKVEQLEKENKEFKQQELTMSYDSRLSYLKQRCEYLERSNNRREDEIIELRDENVDLVSKNNQLENIRKEAIEYIEDWQSYPHTNCTTHNELKNLLNILNKGSESNANTTN